MVVIHTQFRKESALQREVLKVWWLETYFLGGAGAGYTSSSVWLLIHSLCSLCSLFFQMLSQLTLWDVDLLQLAYAVETWTIACNRCIPWARSRREATAPTLEIRVLSLSLKFFKRLTFMLIAALRFSSNLTVAAQCNTTSTCRKGGMKGKLVILHHHNNIQKGKDREWRW